MCACASTHMAIETMSMAKVLRFLCLAQRVRPNVRNFLSINVHSRPTVAVEPDNPEIVAILNSLAGLNLDRVMAKRREPLVVPHYQLMTLEQLQEVSGLSTDHGPRFSYIRRFKKKRKKKRRICFNLLQYFQNEHLVEKLLMLMRIWLKQSLIK